MLHHLSIGVADLARAASFYDAAFAPLGYRRVWSVADGVGYGLIDGQDKFTLKLEKAGAVVASSARTHIAFAGRTHEAVAAFFAAAIANGGSDLGSPGLRPHYGPSYYAAFVRDPDGYRIEAVCNGVGG